MMRLIGQNLEDETAIRFFYSSDGTISSNVGDLNCRIISLLVGPDLLVRIWWIRYWQPVTL